MSKKLTFTTLSCAALALCLAGPAAFACVTSDALCDAKTHHFTLNNIVLNTDGPVPPGSPIVLNLDWSLEVAPSCPGCIHQLYVGFAGEVSECLYSGGSPNQRKATVKLTAPKEPGRYFVAAARSLQYECTPGQKIPELNAPETVVAIVTVAK
jgi:hypothetical protein